MLTSHNISAHLITRLLLFQKNEQVQKGFNMFCIKNEDRNKNIFNDNALPYVTRISLSNDNYKWNSPTQVHEDCLEIAFIEEGIAYYKLNMASLTAKTGEIVIINPGTLHAVDSSMQNPTKIWNLHIKGLHIDGLAENHLLKNRPFIMLRLQEHTAFVSELFHQMAVLHNKTPNAAGINQFAVCMLISLLYDMQDDFEMIVPDGVDNFAKQLMGYFNSHYAEQLKLEEIAKEFHISSSHLSHEFTKYFGISPINYLINRRICEAKWLLGTTNSTLEEISFSLGYDNVNHFKNLFTKRVGCSPVQYRNKVNAGVSSDLL